MVVAVVGWEVVLLDWVVVVVVMVIVLAWTGASMVVAVLALLVVVVAELLVTEKMAGIVLVWEISRHDVFDSMEMASVESMTTCSKTFFSPSEHFLAAIVKRISTTEEDDSGSEVMGKLLRDRSLSWHVSTF